MKKWLKKNAALVVIAVLVILFVCLSVLIKDPTGGETSEEIQKWYTDTMENGVVVTVIARTGCSHCQAFKPIMTEVQEEYGFNLYWYDIDKLKTKDYNTLTKTYTLTEYSGTPYTFVTNNGEVVSYQSGRVDEETLVNFLKEAGVITEE